MYVERFLEKEIKKYLDKKEIIAIVGARQCGKTTLMKHVFEKLKKAKFISFEDRDVLELFSKDIKAFAETYIKNVNYLFIDEFQYAKQGGKQLKYLYDFFDTKIIISGSSAPELSLHSIKYLVGRIFVFTLYPLSFEEFLNYKDKKTYNFSLKNGLSEPIINKINKYYDEFIIYGGYPRVVLSEDKKEKINVLKNIYNTYFLREIKEILQLQDDFKLSKLIKTLALQVGGLTNYEEIASSTDFKYTELLKNFNILKQTFICIEAKPFFTNKKKELVKSPEIFFLDNGFRNFVIKNFQDVEIRTDIGAINENFVASELIKKDIELKYWRTQNKAEVDFVVEKEGEIIPVEVKSNLKESKVTRSFRNFLESYKPKKGFILSKKYVGKIKIGKTIVQFNPIFSIGKTF